MNTQLYFIMLLFLSFTLAYPLTDDLPLLTDENFAGFEKHALDGNVIPNGARLLRRATGHQNKKQRIEGVPQNNHLGNALQNGLVKVDPTGIHSSSDGRAKVIEMIKRFQAKPLVVNAAKVFEKGGKYDSTKLALSAYGLSNGYNKLPIFTDYAEHIKGIYSDVLAVPMNPGDKVFFIDQLGPSYEELANPDKKFRVPYSLIQLTGITIKRVYNTVSMDPIRGLEIFEAAERLGRAIFDEPTQRNEISDRILSRVEEQIEAAKARSNNQITQDKADELLELTKAKLKNFRENGSGKTMGFNVHPDPCTVGHWHCRIFAVLEETEKGKGDQTHHTGPEQKRVNLIGADVIAVFQKKKIAIDHVLSRFVKGDGQITSKDVIEAQKSLPEYKEERKMIDGMRKALEEMAGDSVVSDVRGKKYGWTLSGLKKRTA
jgi:hypothetical protein